MSGGWPHGPYGVPSKPSGLELHIETKVCNSFHYRSDTMVAMLIDMAEVKSRTSISIGPIGSMICKQ